MQSSYFQTGTQWEYSICLSLFFLHLLPCIRYMEKAVAPMSCEDCSFRINLFFSYVIYFFKLIAFTLKIPSNRQLQWSHDCSVLLIIRGKYSLSYMINSVYFDYKQATVAGHKPATSVPGQTVASNSLAIGAQY